MRTMSDNRTTPPDRNDFDLGDADDEPRSLAAPAEVLASIGDESRAIPFEQLSALSAPADETARQLLALWPRLSPARRRELLASFQRLAEEDATLDFSRAHLSALLDPDPATRILAIRGLEEHDREEFMAILLDIVRKDAEALVRAAAAEALGRFVVTMEFGMLTEEAAERLQEALRDAVEDVTEDDDVRARALEAVGASSEEWVSELIVDQYETGNVRLRAAAVRAMGRNAADEWLPILIHNFDDDDSDIRVAAALASGQLLMEEAVNPLTALIGDEEQAVREAAIRALGEIAGEAAEAILLDLVRGRDPDLIPAAQEALLNARMISVDMTDATGHPARQQAEADDE